MTKRAESWEAFRTLVRHNEAAEIRTMLAKAIQDIQANEEIIDLIRNNSQQDIHNLIKIAANKLMEMEIVKEEEQIILDHEQARDCVQKFVMTKLFKVFFYGSEEDERREKDVVWKALCLSTWITPTHLEMPSEIANDPLLEKAQKHLVEMESFKDPMDRLICIINCCQILSNVLTSTSEEGEVIAAADDFLPTLIYVLIKSGLKNPLLSVQYIGKFCHPEQLESASAYWFTHFYSAVAFVETLDCEALSLDEEEYQAYMQEAEMQLVQYIEKSQTEEVDSTTSALLPSTPKHGDEFDKKAHKMFSQLKVKSFQFKGRSFESMTIFELRELFEEYEQMASWIERTRSEISVEGRNDRRKLFGLF